MRSTHSASATSYTSALVGHNRIDNTSRMVYRLLHVSSVTTPVTSTHNHQRHGVAILKRQVAKPPLGGARQRYTTISAPIHCSRIGRIDSLALERMRTPEQVKCLDEVRKGGERSVLVW